MMAVLAVLAVIGLGYYPVAWTARWEEARFFERGVATATVLEQDSFGRMIVRLKALDGSRLTASVDPSTRITMKGNRVPEEIKF